MTTAPDQHFASDPKELEKLPLVDPQPPSPSDPTCATTGVTAQGVTLDDGQDEEAAADREG